jgi:hypothetical protein
MADFNTEKPLVIKAKFMTRATCLINKRIDARNYYWSLSGRQKLSDFLDVRDVPKLDLVYATHSLMYFHPLLFREVMETIVSRMNPGAQMVCLPIIGGDPGGFMNGGFDNRSDVQSSGNKQRSWKDLMRECVIEPEGGHNALMESWSSLSRSELLNEFNTVKELYNKLGVLTDKEIAENFNPWLFEADEKRFKSFVYEVLERGFVKLKRKRLVEVAEKKEKIIDSLQNVDIKRFGFYGVVLTKK